MSRIHRVLFYFTRDDATLEKWSRLYIHNRNLYQKGQSEVQFLKNTFSVQSVMVLWLFIKSIWPEFPLWVFGCVMPVLLLLQMFGHWALGYWWDRNDLYDRESDWLNRRNPIQKAVSETLLDGRGL